MAIFLQLLTTNVAGDISFQGDMLTGERTSFDTSSHLFALRRLAELRTETIKRLAFFFPPVHHFSGTFFAEDEDTSRPECNLAVHVLVVHLQCDSAEEYRALLVSNRRSR